MQSVLHVAFGLAVITASSLPAAQEAPKRSGPLAGLPSKPGPHIDKIKALGDNQWIDIGPAAPDPKWGSGAVLSWGCKMPYAAELGGALVYGQGPHGMVKANGYFDDLFFYDLNAHRWICLYPGINTKTFAQDIKSGEIKIGEKGYMVYKDGQPVYACGGHTYQSGVYDSERHLFGFGGWPTGVGGDQYADQGSMAWYREGRTLLEAQLKDKSKRGDWVSYSYDVTTGKLSHEGGNGHFYIPTKKATWTFWRNMTTLSNVGELHPKGPLPAVNYDSDFGACYDSKRDRVYVGRLNRPADPPAVGDFYIYDVATNAWSNPPCKGTIEQMPATNSGVVHYDTANDRVIVMYGWAGGDKHRVAAWDPETFTWEAPTELPAAMSKSQVTGFYSPEVNAHVLHCAGDASSGDFWVYRYRNPKKKPASK